MGHRCHPHARGHSPIADRRPLLGNHPTHVCSLASPARLAVNVSLSSYVSSSRDDDIEDITPQHRGREPGEDPIARFASQEAEELANLRRRRPPR